MFDTCKKFIASGETLRRWIVSGVCAFAVYSLLWLIVSWRLNDWEYHIYDTLWNFVGCMVFAAVSFAVSGVVTRLWRDMRGGELIALVATMAANLALSVALDILAYGTFESDNYWELIDIYIICTTSSVLSLLNIQHSHHVAMRQMRLKLLQQQLSPHFVFNCLSTLQGVIADNPRQARDYVITLSDIMRYITENIGNEKVALADAVSFIKSYAQMLEVRYPGHFVFNFDIGETDAFIVPVSLQIAIENAVKHNSHSQRQPLEISIALAGDAIEVRNRKKRIVSDGGLGVGLANLDRRYRLLTGRGLDIDETKDYYTVKIPLTR